MDEEINSKIKCIAPFSASFETKTPKKSEIGTTTFPTKVNLCAVH